MPDDVCTLLCAIKKPWTRLSTRFAEAGVLNPWWTTPTRKKCRLKQFCSTGIHRVWTKVVSRTLSGIMKQRKQTTTHSRINATEENVQVALNPAQLAHQDQLKPLLVSTGTVLCLLFALAMPAAAFANPNVNCLPSSPVYRLTFAKKDIAYICINKRMRLFFGFMVGQSFLMKP